MKMTSLKTVLSILLATVFMTSRSTAAGDNARFGLGGGYTLTVLDFQDSGENRSDGLFLALEWEYEGGGLLRFGLSNSVDDWSALVDADSDGELDAVTIPSETTVTRADLAAGYRWNPGGTARPHIYGGLSYLDILEEVGGTRIINDTSGSLVIGFGLIVGSEHHWFTFDFVNDLEHKVRFESGSDDTTFDYRGVRVGWMYRW